MKKTALVLLLLASNVYASELALNLGTSIPLTDVDVTSQGGGKAKEGSAGLGIGGRMLFTVTPALSLGGELNYSGSGETTSTTFIPRANSTLSNKTLTVMALAKARLTQNKVFPYVIGGLGVASHRMIIDAQPANGFVWANTGTAETRSLVDSTKSVFAYTLGLGVQADVLDNLFIGFEARYLGIAKATYETTADAQNTFRVNSIEGDPRFFNIGAIVGVKF